MKIAIAIIAVFFAYKAVNLAGYAIVQIATYEVDTG